MALISSRPFNDALLPIPASGKTPARVAHVLEPEYHQDVYRLPGELAASSKHGAFQVGADGILTREPNRGKQPEYVDDIDEPDTLSFIGKLQSTGERLTADDTTNVAALKSIAVRTGYVDIDAARSISAESFRITSNRAGVIRGDVLINSTGDGTIGRVAVYHYDFPAVVDGHVTILRFADPSLGWYAAAYLLTTPGQHQIYRYINGSSGQVEIYPQDIARLWIPKQSLDTMKQTGDALMRACLQFERFRAQMGAALAQAALDD